MVSHTWEGDTSAGGYWNRPWWPLEESGASLGRNAIRDQVPGQNKAVVAALTLLVDEGFVAVTEQGQAHLHHSVKPYREDMG